MNEANIQDSEISGDFVQGNKYQQASLTALEVTIDKIVENHGGDSELVDVFEELAEYLTSHPDREIIGLEAKLEQGNRLDLKDKALKLKNRFDRKITKRQFSSVFQKVHLQVLSSIITSFDAKVRPLILKGASIQDIDAAIHDSVILPAHRAVVRFNDMSTTEDVCGMLYFLTGKCHIMWK